ncbi:MAG: xanthine dehydrogenase family protein molybdopterin-binding subunit [Xanthobacteraceae bacterium]
MQDLPLSPATERDFALQKFGIGQPVRRKEDDRLLRGHGRYTDDINLPGQAHAWIVRSAYAHGVIKAIDTSPARAMPGVLGVWTGADLAAAGYGRLTCPLPLKNADGSPMLQTDRPALATDKVRFVGDPVAIVVAETAAQARDAAEAVSVEIAALPAVTEAEAAAASDAPLIYDHIPNNTPLHYHSGDADAVRQAFAQAAHVTRLDLVNNRVAVVPMEPRVGVAAYDVADGRFTLYAPTQGVAGGRDSLAKLLNIASDKVRLVTIHVGGSFGMKNASYPEYLCILHAAKALGRPVKWLDERSTSFLTDNHGRAQTVCAELALAADGAFLAVRVTGYGNIGAYLTGVAPIPLATNIGKNIASVYRTPLIEIDIRCVLTNTSLMGAYRGAGRPEANYFMERLIDLAAAEMNLDRVSLRRRNLIGPHEIPYKAGSGLTYDSGNFPAVLDRALALADYEGFAARKREALARGRLRGIAVGCYLEVTAGGAELGKVTFDGNGRVTVTTGTLDFGQGHGTTFAQVLGERLGVPFEAIRLEQSDSDLVHTGNGTGGSRSIMASGTAIAEAAERVTAKGKAVAAQLLEAAEADIEFSDGRFTIAGTDRSIGIMDLARQRPGLLDIDHTAKNIPSAFPNGCHIAEVEVDPATGEVSVAAYTCVNDFGTVINPMIVEGQLHGGVTQGIGQALMEEVRYDDDGQPITGSLMDYALPRADSVPSFRIANLPSPATSNPLGAKGCGEAGCAGSLASLANAVIDALSDHGIRHLDMPLTPERVWRAIDDARRRAAG